MDTTGHTVERRDTALDESTTPITIALVLLLVGSFGVQVLGSVQAIGWAVVLIPALFAIVCFWGAATLLLRRQADMWTPLPWWLLTAGIYYGLGTLASALASEDSISMMSEFFDAGEIVILRTIQLNLVGLVAVLVGYRFGNYRSVANLGRKLQPIPRTEGFWIAAFLAIGMPVFFLLKIPAAFGMFETLVVPESLMVLVTFYVAALALMAGLIAGGRTGLIGLFLILFAGHAWGSLLMFSKLEYVLLLLGILLGICRVRKSLYGLAGGLAVLVAVYLVSVPFVDFGRDNTRSQGSTESRTAAAADFASGGYLDDSADEGVQRWWTRLDYVPAQGFVMQEFDNGRPGGTFDTLAYAFVPRMLWAGKPFVTQGDRMTYLVNGSTTSMSSPTVVGECYWAGGWWLVVLGGFFVGLVQRFSRELISPAIESGNVGLIPFALVMVRMGLRPDDYFVATWIASLPVLVLVLVFLRWMSFMQGSGSTTVAVRPLATFGKT
jgi:hypothetical protein